jgi:hypothetical protein
VASVGLDSRPGLREIAIGHALWLAGRSGALYAAARLRRARDSYDAARDFDLRDPAAGPWATTPFLIRRLGDPAVAGRRRRNYSVLLAGLADLVPPPFADLPAGASPFMLPIAVPDRARAIPRLRAHGVVALDFWAVAHPSLPRAGFPQAAARRAGTIGLPVHQELRDSDLRRVIAAARDVTSGAP